MEIVILPFIKKKSKICNYLRIELLFGLLENRTTRHKVPVQTINHLLRDFGESVRDCCICHIHTHQTWTGYASCSHEYIMLASSELERARRKPLLLFVFDGVLLFRLATRQFVALLFQLPPRRTRLEPSFSQMHPYDIQ